VTTEECLRSLPAEEFFLTRYRSAPLPERVDAFSYRVVARKLSSEREASVLATVAYRLGRRNDGMPVVRLSGRTLVAGEELGVLDVEDGVTVEPLGPEPLAYHSAVGRRALLRLVRGYLKERAADHGFVVGFADFVLSPRFRLTDEAGRMGLQTGVVFTLELSTTNCLELDCDMKSKILRQQSIAARLAEEPSFDPRGATVSSLTVAETLVVHDVLTRRVGDVDAELGMSIVDYNRANGRYPADLVPDPDSPVVVCRAEPSGKLYHYDGQVLHETLDLRQARSLDKAFAARLADATRMDTSERERFCTYFVKQVSEGNGPPFIAFQPHADVVGRGNGYRAWNVALPRDNLVFGGERTAAGIERGVLEHGCFSLPDRVVLGVLHPASRGKGAETFVGTLLEGLTEVGRGCTFDVVFSGGYEPRNPFKIQAAVAELAASKAELAIVLLPGRGEGSPYGMLKAELAKRRLPSQMLHLDTRLSRRELVNVLVGVTSKLGRSENWRLGRLLWPPDLFVGLGAGRVDDERVAAVATAFDGTGRALDVTVEVFGQADDGIGESRLLHLLEGALLAYRSVHGHLPTAVAVHRDGEFVEHRYRRVWSHFKDLGVAMTLVAVDVALPPRVGRFRRDRREPPDPGTLVLTDESSGLVITSAPHGSRGCPRPVAFRRVAGLVGARAIGGHLFWLSRAHTGSVEPPRLPVTVHFARKVVDMVREGLVHQGTMGARMLFV